jgi:outer membrane protein assembly factor BamB
MRRPVRMTPAVADGKVFIGGEDGRLFALDASTGDVVWRFDAEGSVVSSPVVSNGRLYFGSLDTYFYALNARTGQLLWRYRTGGQIYSSPALFANLLYFGSRDRTMYALSLEGDLTWSKVTSGEIWSSPAIADGQVIIGDTDGMLYAFDTRYGTSRWTAEVGSTRATPVISGRVIYIAGGENRLSAAALATGEILATTQVGTDGIEASVALGDDSLFLIAMDGTLQRLTFNPESPASFSLDWETNIGGPAYSSPSYADGVIYVVTEAGGLLYAFDAQTGTELWRYQTGQQGDWRASTPVLVDGVLFIGSDTEGVLALEGG